MQYQYKTNKQNNNQPPQKHKAHSPKTDELIVQHNLLN